MSPDRGIVTRLPLASPSAFLTGQEELGAFRRSLFAAQEQHRAMLDAIQAGEGARAVSVAREHARLARRNLRIALDAAHEGGHRIAGLTLVSFDQAR